MLPAPIHPFIEKFPHNTKAYGLNSAWPYPSNIRFSAGIVLG
jgi:hypothetical protein